MTNRSGTTVEGDEALARSLSSASRDLEDFSRAGSETANLIANRGRVEVPRRTGALASSITPNVDRNEAAISSSLAYANRTHWGWAAVGQAAQPFLTDPAESMENQWFGFYVDEAERILHTVKGA